MTLKREKPLSIRDEIHGDINFDHTLKQVIDHPYFQRLRYIKQLGLAEYVFPCATHTRFQHSLGASYLAGQYFDTMLRGWLVSPFHYEGLCGKTRFYSERTRICLEKVAADRRTREFWWQTCSLGGLLHDIGHGPWSHTFEYLELDQDFSEIISQMTGAVGRYFREVTKHKGRLSHEDISIVYIFKLLSDLETNGGLRDAMRFFLPVAMLINKKMVTGNFQAAMEEELGSVLRDFEYEGGTDVHKLIRPIISGPFDVDRMDYIQRDGRNCGVSIGGIEWRRIVTKLIPILADHAGNKGESKEVVLISNIKNQHVLDDFIFSLFQMYAQVYLHPKIVGVEEIIKRLLLKRLEKRRGPKVTFELHQSLSDDQFRRMLIDDFGVPEIEEILQRRPSAHFQVARFPADTGAERELKKHGFSLINTQDRPMMKDSLGLFLFSLFKAKTSNGTHLIRPWVDVSPIAQQFFKINYSPRIWMRTELLK